MIPKTAGCYMAAYVGELQRTKQMTFPFAREETRSLAIVLLNGDVFYGYWRVFGDGFDVHPSTVQQCPVRMSSVSGWRRISTERLRSARSTNRIGV